MIMSMNLFRFRHYFTAQGSESLKSNLDLLSWQRNPSKVDFLWHQVRCNKFQESNLQPRWTGSKSVKARPVRRETHRFDKFHTQQSAELIASTPGAMRKSNLQRDKASGDSEWKTSHITQVTFFGENVESAILLHVSDINQNSLINSSHTFWPLAGPWKDANPCWPKCGFFCTTTIHLGYFESLKLPFTKVQWLAGAINNSLHLCVWQF